MDVRKPGSKIVPLPHSRHKRTLLTHTGSEDAPFQGSEEPLSLLRNWRRRSDSNRCIEVLQTSPLPLGYAALPGLAN